MSWKFIGELLGVISGALFILPALALNKHLRAIKTSQDKLALGATQLSQAIASRVQPVLEDAKTPAWSRRDQWLLILGVVAFIASSLIKLIVG
jgi:hypothetical protein